MGRTTVHIKSGRAQRILRELAKLQEFVSTIAVKGDYAERGRSIAEIALMHELGTVNMPSRPLFRTAAARAEEIKQGFTVGISEIINGNRRAITVARRVARAMRAAVIDAIDTADKWAAALAPATVEKKGHSHPLIDSGRLRDSIHWRVTRDGRTVEEGK